MSNFGIGLGGFMDGFQKSQRLRMERDQDEQRQTLLDRQMARQDKQDARQDGLNSRADAEYERAETQRKAISDIGIGAQKEFNSRVSAGTAKPGDFDSFWSSYALPKLKNTYLANGDLDSARKISEWGESADTKAGAKLAMSSILKARTGDITGALSDAMEVGKLKGYLDHSYDISGFDTLQEQEGGPVVGYRLNLKTPDGKDVQQDLPLAEIPKLIATYLNPEAAWKSQVDAQTKASEKAEELKTYEQKKQIDRKYGTGENKQRNDAISALRKRMNGGLDGDEQKFDDLSREEQEKLIGKELELQGGQPGIGTAAQSSAGPRADGQRAPAQKVLYNKNTGEIRNAVAPDAAPAPNSSAQAAAAAKPRELSTSEKVAEVRAAKVALGQGANPEEVKQRLKSSGIPEYQWPEFPAPATPAEGAGSRADNVTYLIQAAEVAIKEGQHPQRIAEELAANGIPEDQWPPSLRTSVDRVRTHSVGIGR